MDSSTLGVFSKPVATTVMFISSVRRSSKAVPQMMLASGWADWVIMEAAVSTSSRPMSGLEVMLMMTPRAPAMLVSSSGLESECGDGGNFRVQLLGHGRNG